MKKFFVLLLAVLMLGLCACGGAAETDEAKETAGGFRVGYAKVNITPEDSVPLGGYGNSLNRMSTGFTEYIYATCIAVTDSQGESMVLLGVDMGNTGGKLIPVIRTQISEQTGIPQERIIISASHMHSFPDIWISHQSLDRYFPLFSAALVKVAVDAMADRTPAELYTTTAVTEGLNFVRRYKMEDGSVLGYESDVADSGLAIVGHETEADPVLQLVKFDRGEDKTDILLANYQVHPHRGAGSSSTLITADLVGIFRDEVSAKLGYDVIYITGASGNVNPYSLVPEENITKDYKEQGRALAAYAIGAEGTYTKVESGLVTHTTRNFDGKVDHSTDGMVSVAQQALDYYKQTNSVAAMREKYLSYGISSPNYANMIINRSAKVDWPFDIWAVSIGDIAFAVAPYEMFDTQGMFIKENSPFAMTIVTTCANGGFGYMPSRESHANGGYEAENTYYVAGSAEQLADLYVEMLGQLHDGK